MGGDIEFRTVLLDPPFPEFGGGKSTRGAQRHFELIRTRHEMLRTILDCPHWPPADDAHVYMWMTDNYTTWGMWLLDCFGAKVHRSLPWRKTRMGLGRYFRGCHETLWFATMGKGMSVRTETNSLRTDALLDLKWSGRHSEKPPAAYDLIEARSNGPYLDMFARKTREGWTSWGDEVKVGPWQ